jgi:predicted unusual protein kinase regulating ubiquinone biosynthesis (AarF/ABC1/UbiB family)
MAAMVARTRAPPRLKLVKNKSPRSVMTATAAPTPAAPTPAAKAARLVGTVRYVARTYRTLSDMRGGRLTPSEAGAALARDASAQGVVVIKMCQAVSARRDALDPDLADALAAVQDRVTVPEPGPPPVVPGYRIDPAPVASASIADVYRGVRVKDGLAVAVKRRRDGVSEAVATDVPMLAGVMFAAAALGLPGARNIAELVRESLPMLRRETDFREEARATERFGELFQDVGWLRVPRVVRADEDVLVTTWVDARPLRRVRGPNPALARRLMDLYIRMLDAGLVHADPHPGNVGVRSDGTIVLYDFGATLDVGPDVKDHVVKGIVAGVTRDAEGLLAALEGLGAVRVPAGRRLAARSALRRALDGDVHTTLAAAPEFSSSDPATRLVSFDARFVYLVRTFTMINAACVALDPAFEYDYARWVSGNALGGAAGLARDVAAAPGTLRSMHADMELFQSAVLDQMAAARGLARWAALAALAAFALGRVV